MSHHPTTIHAAIFLGLLLYGSCTGLAQAPQRLPLCDAVPMLYPEDIILQHSPYPVALIFFLAPRQQCLLNSEALGEEVSFRLSTP